MAVDNMDEAEIKSKTVKKLQKIFAEEKTYREIIVTTEIKK